MLIPLLTPKYIMLLPTLLLLAAMLGDHVLYGRSQIPSAIHQTWISHNQLTSELITYRESWLQLNPNTTILFYSDLDALDFIGVYFPDWCDVYEALPLPVLKADLFRYLVMMKRGGIYTDIDTTCIKPLKQWNRTEQWDDVGFVVGVESDSIWDPDWSHHGIARKLQIVQWTFASKPDHPILKKLLEKVREYTPYFMALYLTSKGKHPSVQDVLDWTGPGVWSDVIFEYLKDEYGVASEQLSGLTKEKLIGDVLFLPITGFAPGRVAGAGGLNHPEARVQHNYLASWISSATFHI